MPVENKRPRHQMWHNIVLRYRQGRGGRKLKLDHEAQVLPHLKRAYCLIGIQRARKDDTYMEVLTRDDAQQLIAVLTQFVEDAAP